MASMRARLGRIKDDPAVLIDPGTVERACREAGHRWRERTLDPVRTLQAFALQVAHGNTAIAHIVRLTGGRFTESAYCQARARLPVAVLRAVLDESVTRGIHGDDPWRGHRVVLIDGTGVSAPDTPELRGALGVHSNCAQRCGLPLAKVLTVFGAHDGRLLGLHIAPGSSGDLKHAGDLHPALAPGDVLVGDRGLCAYTHLAELARIGCHGLFRMASCRAMPFPARRGKRRPLKYNRHRRGEPILVELIARDDQVVEIVKPHNRPEHMTPERFAAIPGTLVVRALRYTATGPGVRTRQITLLTTLTDAAKYPASALAELYLKRWRIEVNLRHLKRTLGMDRLKCRSLDGMTREVLMLALIYNAVCRARAAAARRLEVAPTRLSFIDTLRALRLAVHGGNAEPPLPPRLWPLRPHRCHPRQLKRAHSNFPVMVRPRNEYLRWLETSRGSAI